ncbi:hypothetical protein FE257_011609 [Aspergillus nanangensis]|uniref:Xylanolytic transcriptional activator regulatory domain-containing protein n=1 Tax=Aspergillus nanangensis TaxID=2582783 RepID=A0AAD4GXS3_ASPNN|nr:hypothetical protein FE257_011609 [Aspergillus nanangensis]
MVSSSMPLHFAGRELGPVSLITGIPFLSPSGQQWVQARTGQHIAFDKLSPSRPPWEKKRAQSTNTFLDDLKNQNLFELPDRNLLELYFEKYHSSLMRRIFPALDPILFQETMKSAYQEPYSNSFGQISNRACIFAFLAFASITNHPCFDREDIELPPINGEAYVLKVQHLMPQVLQETTTLDSLQAVTILALYELFNGNLQSASYYGSVSASMIFMLGANTFSFQPSAFRTSSEEIKYRVHRHLRNLFWLCYTIEKDICLRTGQPQLFTDENCDLTLPPGYVEQLYTSMEYHHLSRELPESPLFPVDLRLSVVKARAYSALYSFKALQKSDAELLKEIRELDELLERWRMSVPLEWRPTLSFSHETPDPNVTLMAIFCNILQNPSDPQATKDLGLLKTATSMMERVFLRQSYSVTEIVHIKLVADFVTELHRLASCAIEKAWNERSR